MVLVKTIKKKRIRKLTLLLLLLLSLCIFLTSCSMQDFENNIDSTLDPWLDFIFGFEPDQTESKNESQVPVVVNGEMTIHFIDVGQADATLFVQNGHAMLFDAATKSRGDELVNYIQNLGINYIDVLILSHPHDDHMGGSAKVLNSIEVGAIYGPDIFDISSLDTLRWYQDLLDAVDSIDESRNNGIPENKQTSIWHFPRDSKGNFAKFNIGEATVELLAPLEDKYSDLNDYSICAKVTFGDIDVILTGDATSKVEKALIEEGYNLDVEIFQAAHHGSDTGNSKEFLDAMSPETIVISCGMENKYNHPTESVIKLYKKMKIPVYRTDESGDIVMTTNGTTYSFNKKPGTYTSGATYNEKGK